MEDQSNMIDGGGVDLININFDKKRNRTYIAAASGYKLHYLICLPFPVSFDDADVFVRLDDWACKGTVPVLWANHLM